MMRLDLVPFLIFTLFAARGSASSMAARESMNTLGTRFGERF